MNYVSTRGASVSAVPGKTGAQAIMKGIAEDRGLFVPKSMPEILGDLAALKNMNYRGVAKRVLAGYLPDYTGEELSRCVDSAYDAKFESPDIVPLVRAGNVHILELFHGRTAAFKDLALSILPHLLTTALKKEQADKRIAILVATSGDTGKAALEGFAGVADTEVIVFYPHVGVSQVQQRQMTTQEGSNTHVFGIRGNFDDAQTAVKRLFHDPRLATELESKGWQFSSANSINIGRLVPQVVYYVWAYVKLLEQNALKPGEKMNVVVPTGNFGNILVAYYARELGIPIGKFICASNQNNVLTDFINTGFYDIRRRFYVTSSPSMDILISSNLERLLYHLSGNDGPQVEGLMQELETEKFYEVGDDIRTGLTDFFGGYATEGETRDAIGQMIREHGYLMDPHTAVGYKVYNDYRQMTGDTSVTVIAATASAYKFADTVAEAIGLGKTPDGFSAISILEEATGVPVPIGLRDLEIKKVLHKEILATPEIEAAVLNCLARNSNAK